MKITIESTTRVVGALLETANSIDCRVWEGETESGIKVFCLIPRIAAKAGQDLSQFEAELTEVRPPSPDATTVFPLRLIL